MENINGKKENTEEKELQVIDIDNRVYTLGKQIGQGGQGAVYLVKDDSDIAIKLVTNKEGAPVTDMESIRKISKKLTELRELPIPQKINLSVPLAILKSHAGYVMSFMNGMNSLGEFLKLTVSIKDDEVPSWLLNKDGSSIEDAELWINYCKTGGLRSRFLALYKASELLACIHTKGLCYVDISDGNLMYKEDEEGFSASLIDTDNICFSGKGETWMTKGYGAPEIVTGKSSATIYSDSYSFAVAAFKILTMKHPFMGKKVYDAEDDGWSKTETKTQNENKDEFFDDGSYPWIYDYEDDSNAYGNREQDMSLFLNPHLFALFDNTFSVGHNKPELRTPLISWPKAFAQAADSTIKCKSCGMSYFYTYKENNEYCCPYCLKKRGRILLVKTYLTSDEEGPSYVFSHELNSKEVIIPSRCFYPFKINEGDKPVAGITQKEDAIEIRAIGRDRQIYVEINGVKEPFVGTYKFICSKDENFKYKLSLGNRIVIISGEY